MAGAFLGGVGGIDSPHALVSELSVTSSPTNQNLKMGGYGIRPYETTGILLTLLSFRPKKNGPQKRNAHRRRSLPSANTGRAPSGMGPAMFAPSQWGIKNLFQKGFCGAFSLKKRPLRPQAPPAKSKFEGERPMVAPTNEFRQRTCFLCRFVL